MAGTTARFLSEEVGVRVEAFLRRLRGVQKCGDGWKAFCPGHEDGERSLSVTIGKGGKVLLHCFAGCAVEAIAGGLGVEVPDLFNDDGRTASERLGKPRIGAGSKGGGGEPAIEEGKVTLAGLAEFVALPVAFLAECGLREGRGGVVVSYRGEDGSALHEKVRKTIRGKGPKYVYAKSGTKAAPYGLWRLQRYRETHKALVLVEGESDSWTLWHHGLPALGIPGASNYGVLQAEHLAGIEKVFVVQEPGGGGDVFVQGIGERLRQVEYAGEAFAVRMPGEIKDPSELHKADPAAFVAEFRRACQRGVPLDGPTVEEMFETAADVVEEAVSFLWYPYLLRGELNIVMGKPGEGKGQASLAIAAAVTRGGELPGGARMTPSDVLIFAPEDATSKVVVPRLRACGADLARARIFKFQEHGFQFSEEDRARLEMALDRFRPSLVIFDPIVAFMGSGTDVYKATAVRAVLQPMAQIAARSGACFLLVAHARKGTVSQALDQLFGSVDFGAIVRSAVGVYPHPRIESSESATHAVFSHVKHNLSPRGATLSFRIENEAEHKAGGEVVTRSRFEWGPVLDGVAAEDLLPSAAGSEDRAGVKEAVALLGELLGNGGEMASEEVQRIAAGIGISKTTLHRARQQAGVDWRRDGFGAGSQVFWFFPKEDEERGARRKVAGAGGRKDPENRTLWDKAPF